MDAYIAEIERATARNDTLSSFYGEKGWWLLLAKLGLSIHTRLSGGLNTHIPALVLTHTSDPSL